MRYLYILLCAWMAVAKPGNKKEFLENLKTREGKSLKSSISKLLDQLDTKRKKKENKIVWKDWEELQKPGKWHKNMIKDWYNHPHGQDDPIANLLQTMIMHDKQGNPHAPKGIDPSKKMSAKAENHDSHIYPKGWKGGQHSKDKRNFAEKYINLWDSGYIPYAIDSKFTQEQKNIVYSAIDEFMEKTCLSFIPWYNAEYFPHRVYLFFTYGDSCSSIVGRIKGGTTSGLHAQKIELKAPTCFEKRTVIHEIMHALGQVHEQQRTDRDEYVIMHWDEMKDGSKMNMEKLPIGSHDRTHYDPSSILQYDLKAFTKTGGKTMTFHDEKLESLVGSSNHLTHADAKEINLAYKCSSKCESPPVCQNYGFLNKGCRCICPDGLTGPECRRVDSDPECGGILAMNAVDVKRLQSLKYPNAYPVDANCVVFITAPKGSKIKLEVDELNLRKNTDDNYCLHWIEVRYINPEINGPKFCEAFAPIVSESNQMIIRFNSRFSKDYLPYPGQRFSLRVSTGQDGDGVNCNFEGSSPCRMVKHNLKERKNTYWADPSSGAKGSAGYAYIDTQTNFALTTPSDTFSDGNHCIKFSYYMKGQGGIGIYDFGASKQWWFTSNPTNDGSWWSGRGDYYATKSTRLQIYGYLTSEGIVAIDEVEISTGSCSQ